MNTDHVNFIHGMFPSHDTNLDIDTGVLSTLYGVNIFKGIQDVLSISYLPEHQFAPTKEEAQWVDDVLMVEEGGIDGTDQNVQDSSDDMDVVNSDSTIYSFDLEDFVCIV